MAGHEGCSYGFAIERGLPMNTGVLTWVWVVGAVLALVVLWGLLRLLRLGGCGYWVAFMFWGGLSVWTVMVFLSGRVHL